MRNVEILAPAGSFESLCGAINGGCDAVYLGGSHFGARAFAENFDEESMLRAIDYVHTYDKKIYLTVNTLLHNQEIEEELFEYLRKYYMQGLDAVIVQDPGVLAFIHRNFPKLPIHASTQMTFTTEQGGELLKDYGVTRFVTSRELSIAEIGNMRKRTDLEIETFVHGALCYCYSGQCFLSSMIGGRSGNRGRCAQPCRMAYKVSDSEGERIQSQPYILSPKDICTLDRIPDLVEAGIDSFKIEGRMKKPEYAAYTAQLYRKYTDLYLEYGDKYTEYLRKHKRELEQDYNCLMDLYNRGGFSTGYFYDKNGPQLMSMTRPNHSGVLVGKVQSIKKNRATIRLEEDIYAQDVLEFRRKDGTVLYEYTVKEGVSARDGLTQTNTKPGSKITPGTPVYRTRRNELLSRIQQDILQNQKKVAVSFVLSVVLGQPIRLTCKSGQTEVTVYGQVVEAAKSQPMTEEKMKRQLGKINTTCFSLAHCEVEMTDAVFVPVGQLNELRRDALEQLTNALVAPYRRENPVPHPMSDMDVSGDAYHGPVVSVSVETVEQAGVAEKITGVEQLYLDLGSMEQKEILRFLQETKKNVYLILPAIMREKEYEQYAKAFERVYGQNSPTSVLEKIVASEKVKGFLVKNYEGFALYRQYIAERTDKKCRLDYNMYSFNREAKAFWRKFGIEQTTVAVEMNGAEIRRNGCKDQEIIVYGRTAVMTSAQCVCKNTMGCNKSPGTILLTDKFDKTYVNKNRCGYCYNQMYEKLPVSLHEHVQEILEWEPAQIRISLLDETKEETRAILQYFVQTFCEGKETGCPITEYTTGHFRKGVK